MRILITGGAGFIGSNLARAHVAAGDEVVVLDNLVAVRSTRLIDDLIDRLEFHHCDIRCNEDFDGLGGEPFDRVYHLAASFANELSLRHPKLDMRTNIEGTLNVVDYARRVGCGLMVYAGSSSSYGDLEPPFLEDDVIRPRTPYALSKYAAEDYVRGSGLSSCVYRLFNVYGPGDFPGRFRNAIPNMFAALAAPGGYISVYGETATRDFTYVGDVVEVLMRSERAAGWTVNVGSGVEVPIVDLARRILRTLGLAEDRMKVSPLREWDTVARRCADVQRLRALFDSVPSTPLDRGLARTAEWLRESGLLQAPR